MTGVLRVKLTLCICTLVVTVRTLAQAHQRRSPADDRATSACSGGITFSPAFPSHCRCRSKSFASWRYHLASLLLVLDAVGLAPFGRAVRWAGITVSMGSRGAAYDDAVAQAFFTTQKELVNHRAWSESLELLLAVVRVHRGVRRPQASALHPRDALPSDLRSATTRRCDG
jgi:hypothetical protein